MIPRACVVDWRTVAPWPRAEQVEQDLVLSRALVALFERPLVAGALAFRGGTALHKLFLSPAGRYSEDLDLVQIEAGPIGPVFDEVRDALDPWLGEPRWKRSHGRVKLLYRFESSSFPVVRMRVKVEINTREHFAVMGFALRSFAVDSPWFSGTADVRTYHLEELLGTKLRALFQRKKGRDLYDLWLALSLAKVEPPQVLECFRRYMQHGGAAVSRAEFEANLADKLADDLFIADLSMLLPEGGDYDPMVAADLVQDTLISGLAGAPWKGQG